MGAWPCLFRTFLSPVLFCDVSGSSSENPLLLPRRGRPISPVQQAPLSPLLPMNALPPFLPPSLPSSLPPSLPPSRPPSSWGYNTADERRRASSQPALTVLDTEKNFLEYVQRRHRLT
jgi:hypothetical protein